VWRPTLRAPGSGTKELWNSDLTLLRSGSQSSTINEVVIRGAPSQFGFVLQNLYLSLFCHEETTAACLASFCQSSL
jgi:hypothetical protein